MSTTQETTIERSPVLLKLRVDDAGNLNVDADYHTLSAGSDYYDGEGGIGLAGCMSKEQADYIARACNNHEALVAVMHRADELERIANLLACARTNDERNVLCVKLATAQHDYKQARAALTATQ